MLPRDQNDSRLHKHCFRAGFQRINQLLTSVNPETQIEKIRDDRRHIVGEEVRSRCCPNESRHQQIDPLVIEWDVHISANQLVFGQKIFSLLLRDVQGVEL